MFWAWATNLPRPSKPPLGIPTNSWRFTVFHFYFNSNLNQTIIRIHVLLIHKYVRWHLRQAIKTFITSTSAKATTHRWAGIWWSVLHIWYLFIWYFTRKYTLIFDTNEPRLSIFTMPKQWTVRCFFIYFRKKKKFTMHQLKIRWWHKRERESTTNNEEKTSFHTIFDFPRKI